MHTLNCKYNIHGAGTALSAFRDSQIANESVVIGKLIDVNEDGSYALQGVVVHNVTMLGTMEN